VALTLKKKKRSGMIFTTGPELDLEYIIKDCIRSTIMSLLSLPRESMMRNIRYFPTYTVCEHTNEKTLSSIHMKLRHELDYVRITVGEIEITGANCVEFLDYLEEVGAVQISRRDSMEKILEKI